MIKWIKVECSLPEGENINCLINTVKFGIVQSKWNITGKSSWWYSKNLGTFHIKDVTHWVICEGLLP